MRKIELHDFGMVGLGVMGRNFLLNVLDHHFSVSGLDTNDQQLIDLKNEAKDRKVFVTKDMKAFVLSLKKPRKVMLLVPAGKAVDHVIEALLAFLEKGDIIIDGGNSYYSDTDRRIQRLKGTGITFMGIGVSGGAKGARFGPSIMVGGNKGSYNKVKKILEAVSAKHKGKDCVALLGKASAGNYVKMVHNGIEYAMMQLIAEAYDILQTIGGLSNQEIHQAFNKYNKGKLQSFLIEITSKIFIQKDSFTKEDLIDKILDKAKQKGTGKWTSQNALDVGVSLPSINGSVSMRILSSIKSDREALSKIYKPRLLKQKLSKNSLVKLIGDALYFSFIMVFEQGLYLLAQASKEYRYELDMQKVTSVWRNGCIIRAAILEKIHQAYIHDPSLKHIIEDKSMVKEIKSTHNAIRKVLNLSISTGVPVLTFSASLAYFDAIRTERLPLNLTQAQRDYFGSHGFNRNDMDGAFHAAWE